MGDNITREELNLLLAQRDEANAQAEAERARREMLCDERIQALKTSATQLDEKIKTLNEETETLKTKLATLENKLETIDAEVAALKHQVPNLMLALAPAKDYAL